MCLETKQLFLKKATEDITIYKVVIKCPDQTYRSPFRESHEWTLGMLTSSDIQSCKLLEFLALGMQKRRINEGLHAFLNKQGIWARFSRWAFEVNNGYRYNVLMKGIIPKGSKYLISTDKLEIVSDQMILIEETSLDV